MENLTAWGLVSATASEREAVAEQIVDQVSLGLRPKLVSLVASFLAAPVTPASFFSFELGLVMLVREFGRLLLQATANALEPTLPDRLPRDLWCDCRIHRRRNEKTRNPSVATWFGTITLWRRGYRDADRLERAIFPLERLLGLHEGVTPALADWIGRAMAQAGATQSRVLRALREEHGVAMGVKRLRALVQGLSRGLAEFREANQVDVLLAAMETARTSRGSRKPVLSVGRDGITLREYRFRFFEVATAATISVYDRAGKRLTTIYLAAAPELGQATMSDMLTNLLTELLKRWDGPLPQLSYVTDSGDQETNYYHQVLRHMVHPRTGERLSWVRVVDFYHVSERIWTMASLLFGADSRGSVSWARRMLKALKKPNGASRVLHSSASHFHRRKLTRSATKDFWKAYRYLQKRTRFLRYDEYKSKHIPLGSGVTEAACKTVFTQRMKLSGMRWGHAGASTILNLRVILLSGSWQATFSAYIASLNPHEMRPYAPREPTGAAIAA